MKKKELASEIYSWIANRASLGGRTDPRHLYDDTRAFVDGISVAIEDKAIVRAIQHVKKHYLACEDIGDYSPEEAAAIVYAVYRLAQYYP
jgi:hypothetical protein